MTQVGTQEIPIRYLQTGFLP